MAAGGEHRPTVILVLCEPGSGKTELGTTLARTLRVPFLARDDVRTGLYFTTGAWGDQPGPPPSRDEATGTFLCLVETMAGLGVSCVAEYVIRDDRPEDLDVPVLGVSTNDGYGPSIPEIVEFVASCAGGQPA